jgi:hypothetical protein
MHDSGTPRREIAKSYVELEQRHCERSEAIHLATQRKNGLLRFARNDGFTTETSWLFEILKPVCVRSAAFLAPQDASVMPGLDPGIHQSS